MTADDRDLEALLAEALGIDLERTPPPERAAALRAQVQAQIPPGRQPADEPIPLIKPADEPTPLIKPADEPTPLTGPAAEPTSGTKPRHGSRLPRRRDLLVGGIAASVGAVLGLGSTVLTGGDDPPAPGPRTELVSFAGGPPGLTTDAKLIAHTWGTELLLEIAGLPAGRDYQVVYLASDGGSVLAGSFRSVADTLMKCRFNAAPIRREVVAMVIIDPGGQEVSRARLA